MKYLLFFLLLCSTAYGQTITLDGSGTDADGTIVAYKWRLITPSPGAVTFSPSANIAKPTVTAVWIVGVYKFELEVTDNSGAKDLDTMTVTVNQLNAGPLSNAGPDRTITLPASTVSIGLPDGAGLTVQWVKVSGPQGGTIVSPLGSVTQVTGLPKGDFVYRKIVRNSSGVTASDDVSVKVKPKCSWLAKIFGWC